MDRQPVLEGERLVLRPLTQADWEPLFAIASDRQLWALHPMHDRWQEPVFREFFDDALANEGALAVVEKAGGAIIGSSRFQDYRPEGEEQVEIGWTFLARDRWGMGYNSELKRLMMEHAFRFVRRVVFRVGKDNVISRKAMAKIGGRLTDEVDIRDRGGRTIEHVVYEITREDFTSGALA